MQKAGGEIKMTVILGSDRFSEDEFDMALDAIRLINPVIASTLEGLAIYEEDEDYGALK